MSDPIQNHILSAADFDALVIGGGTAATISALRRGQFSKWVMTLGSIINSVGIDRLSEALELLSIAETTAPEIFSETVTSPQVSAWSWTCLEDSIQVVDHNTLDMHIEHLRCVAVAAAIRAKIDFQMSVPLRDGIVSIPSIGQVNFGPGVLQSHALVSSVAGKLIIFCEGQEICEVLISSLHDLESPDKRWQPIRTIWLENKGLVLSVALDDIDPYRHYWASLNQATQRLGDAELHFWTRMVTEAWTQITEDFPEYAESIAAGLKTIVPVGAGEYIEAHVWQHAFGAIGISRPKSSGWLVHGILDSFQRAKLQVLQNLLPIHHAVHDEYRYFDPSFPTPHSLREICESLYAHPVSAKFWDVQRRSLEDPVERIDAEIQFVRWRDRAFALEDFLMASGEITKWGHNILLGAEKSIRKLQIDSPVSVEIRQLSRIVETDFRISWRLRNLYPEHQAIVQMTNAFMASKPCPLNTSMTLFIRTGKLLNGYPTRSKLATLKLAQPLKFKELVDDREALTIEVSHATQGDLAFAQGEIKIALERYKADIQDDPLNREAWAGLSLMRCLGFDSTSQPFSSYPEIIMALHAELALGHQYFVDPLEVAAWIFPLCVILGDLEFTL